MAKALEYSNPAKAVIDHCKGVTILETPTKGGLQKIKFGRESEMYRLIMKSNTEKAESFQDWVCDVVLPSIRKTGSYSIGEMREKAENGEVDSMYLRQQIEVATFAMDSLRMSDASRLLVVSKICEPYGIPLPEYVPSKGVIKSATELLRENGSSMSVREFNKRMVAMGYLSDNERKSANGGVKKFKSLTDTGLEYGENVVSRYNVKETQPEYYSDRFASLLSNLKQA